MTLSELCATRKALHCQSKCLLGHLQPVPGSIRVAVDASERLAGSTFRFRGAHLMRVPAFPCGMMGKIFIRKKGRGGGPPPVQTPAPLFRPC
ncbi:hypothetical protein HZ326_24679 [Fusarium oxysporum f. sp. albedinis]|nr:hypothetical protein HZ326_24679 [Fusarium oxysporum f. sp. albedinis]